MSFWNWKPKNDVVEANATRSSDYFHWFNHIPKFKKAALNIQMKEVKNKVELSVTIYMWSTKIKTKDGKLRSCFFHLLNSTHWIAYKSKISFDSYGRPPLKQLTNFILKRSKKYVFLDRNNMGPSITNCSKFFCWKKTYKWF